MTNKEAVISETGKLSLGDLRDILIIAGVFLFLLVGYITIIFTTTLVFQYHW
jgi:hypothetical protein